MIDSEEQIVIENNHHAIVTEDEFNAIQEKMKKKGKNKSNGQESLFAHIAKCSDCGLGMTYRKDRRNGAYVCCGYVKHGKAFCTSHIIEEEILLQAVKNDLKELISENLKLEKFNEVAIKKASVSQFSHTDELKGIQKLLNQLNKQFQNLLQLYTEGIVSKEQFQMQNEHIAKEQANLSKRKLELETAVESQKDIEKQLEYFKAEVRRFVNLDIDDEQILKQVLHRLIQKVEVFEGGKIKIHYNITSPPSLNEILEQGA